MGRSAICAGSIGPCVITAKVSTTSRKLISSPAGSSVRISCVKLLTTSRRTAESVTPSMDEFRETRYALVPVAGLNDQCPGADVGTGVAAGRESSRPVLDPGRGAVAHAEIDRARRIGNELPRELCT